MRRRQLRRTFTLALGAALAFGAAARSEDTRTILNTTSFWRAHVGTAHWVIRMPDGKLLPEPAALTMPRGWTSVDFEDTSWVRQPGPFFPSSRMDGSLASETTSTHLSLICLRGKFTVVDPAKVSSLSLNIGFRGGAVLYLNGKEVTRRFLPDGELTPGTLAEDYPREAFLRGPRNPIRWGWGDPEKYKTRATRTRRLDSFSIDPKSLRKGVNLLAVELHRTAYHEGCLAKPGDLKSFFKHRGHQTWRNAWTTVGLTDIVLRAAGEGIEPNVARTPGFQVWNADPLLLVFDTDYGDAGAEPMPVQIAGARNGRHSGVLVAGCDQPIVGLKATVSDLILEGGTGRIASGAVEIRYQEPDRVDRQAALRLPGGDSRYTHVQWMDTLMPAPPKNVPVRKKKLHGKQNVVFGAVCPIWMTVHVPKDCATGRYKGTCRIEARGIDPVTVPVMLDVQDWTLPPPHKFRGLLGFHESPESVAMHYKVPFWSDEHFRLLGESFRWLGTVGCKTVFAHLIERTNLGNAQALLRWKRKAGADITFAAGTEGGGKSKQPMAIVSYETHEPDFSVLDRYLETALEHLVAPPVICLYAWDNYCGTWYSGGANNSHNVKPGPARLTELADGKAVSAWGPVYTNVEAAVAFWKPVGEHVQSFMQTRGLEKSLMIGLAHDSHPSGHTVEVWKRILPKAPWAFEGHPRAGSLGSLSGRVPVEWGCTVWGARMSPPRGYTYGWQIPQMQNHFDRDNWRRDAQTQLLGWGHMAVEHNIMGSQRGVGRLSADLWPVIKGNRSDVNKKGELSSISARYPESGWGACNLRQNPFIKPGPNGAVSTGRLEMMREGLQECEALITIQSALLDKAAETKLGADLAKRCNVILAERRRARGSCQGTMGVIQFLGTGRRERVNRLYALAGEVERTLAR